MDSVDVVEVVVSGLVEGIVVVVVAEVSEPELVEATVVLEPIVDIVAVVVV